MSVAAMSSDFSVNLPVSQCAISAICISAIMSAASDLGIRGRTAPFATARFSRGSIKAARLLTQRDRMGVAEECAIQVALLPKMLEERHHLPRRDILADAVCQLARGASQALGQQLLLAGVM
jgi:hypothetical protein